MSKSDYRRPSADQVANEYRCTTCGREVSVPGDFAAPAACPSCGGAMDCVGQSYPADPDDWNESRDNVNDDFHDERRR